MLREMQIHQQQSELKGNLLSRVDLFDVVEDIDDVSDPSGRLLDLGSQAEATHGEYLHWMSHKRLGVVKSLEQHLGRSHGDLKSTTLSAQ
jgi:hypothetical protein